ncbi:YGGT family protein [Fusobacterium gonidiaformans 3-1-5R]|uniref:YGGT family protein n=2 Tax=Fusobacterium TaxID=848 RepID=E5BFB3_9FUSO|nr:MULTISPECIES: YggT family protein [Fusobacterium]AVQ17024.1 YggT family protein [Fusobacterium gonidiaformans ATCC 25563]EFS20794.1 YGGT family protein [Fusobacterium gonidiaformans 3-1-5R]EFS28872.1 hypothetical protein FGAG_01193 [Fusobacterium gonidiaformans ATCC 25563]KXA16463.1 YGGT family protein [Fusobacterium equinum]
MYTILIIVNKLVEVFNILLLIRVVLSWLPMGQNALTRAVYSVTEPILEPIRRTTYPLLGNIPLDISPIIAYFLMQLIRNIVFRIVQVLYF